MDDINEKIKNTERDIQYFDKMVAGAENLILPWKTIAKWLVAALIASNLIWGVIHGYSIYKAYQEPTTIDVQQKQGAAEQEQEQKIKGGLNK